EVTAQRPAAMLKVAGKDGLTAVDNQTRVLNSVTNQAVKGIPVIEVKNIDNALGQRSVRAAVTILDAMPESWRTRVTAVSANTQDSVTTTLDNGITIVWGDSAELKLKMAIVDKIMNDPNVIGDKKQINVSAPGRPIIK
ncbi:MAG: cell division protein FtsQ/DivIB, partial [Bifidobacterium animalis]|nr:cell division protein FtsQ/DivIB [Bifidobacterium animalis]